MEFVSSLNSSKFNLLSTGLNDTLLLLRVKNKTQNLSSLREYLTNVLSCGFYN